MQLRGAGGQLSACEKTGTAAAVAALALYATGYQTSGAAKAACILLMAGLLGETSALLSLRLMSPDVTVRTEVPPTIVFQGAVLGAVGFAAFSSRWRSFCLVAASAAPLILLAVRNTEIPVAAVRKGRNA